MPAPKVERPRLRPARFSLSRLSIKQRLPLLIGALVLGVIVAYTWASYRGVKDSAREVGGERLRNLTQQLATLMQQSANTITSKTFTAANDPAMRAYLRSPLPGARSGVATLLQQFIPPQDQNSVQVELWNANHSLALALPEGASQMSTDLDTEFEQSAASPAFSVVGALRVIKEMIAYPAVAVVKDEGGQLIGYLVRWRRLTSTQEARQQLMDLMGTQTDLYLGNNQGDLWTDMINISPKPPVDVRSTLDVTHYTREGNTSVAALGRPISGTPWFVLVEFSDQVIMTQADRFLRRMLVMGLVLLAVGVASALVLSRSITRPLHSLTEAATAITSGDDSHLVDIRTHDELGALATAFNTMVVQVRDSQRELKHRVRQRTAQLEAANEELESFSYSVSHDLRAPLRAINGFSQALMEVSADKLDEEGKRYLDRVCSASKQMAQLIDDLLQLARVSRSEMRQEIVDLTALARGIVTELQERNPERAVRVNIEQALLTPGDKRLLRVTLNNLLENAWKFTSKQETAEITFGQERKDGETIYFVRDNGAGFDMVYGSKLFGAFQRLHSTREFEGTGIGLATVRRIILRHGGRVWAEGEVNKGATFYFTLGNFTEARHAASAADRIVA